MLSTATTAAHVLFLLSGSWLDGVLSWNQKEKKAIAQTTVNKAEEHQNRKLSPISLLGGKESGEWTDLALPEASWSFQKESVTFDLKCLIPEDRQALGSET